MDEIDTRLDIAFSDARICAGERIPSAEDLRARLRPLVKQAFTDAGWLPPGDKSAYEQAKAEAYEQVSGRPFCDKTTLRNTDTATEARWANKEGDPTINGITLNTPAGRAEERKYMTGPEWYSKLEDLAECNCESHINQVCDKCQIIRPFLKAAKKASGVE